MSLTILFFGFIGNKNSQIATKVNQLTTLINHIKIQNIIVKQFHKYFVFYCYLLLIFTRTHKTIHCKKVKENLTSWTVLGLIVN